MIRCSAAIALTVGCLISADVSAAGMYRFVKVADTSTPAPAGNFSAFNNHPAIGGQAAFGGTYGGQGIFTGSGGPLTTIAKTGDPAPSGTFASLDDPAMKTNGTAAFRGSYLGGTGIFSGGGGALTTIVKTGDAAPSGTFTDLGDPAPVWLPDFGFGFRGVYSGGVGIFIGNGGALTTIVKKGDAAPVGTFNTFTDFGDPAIQDGSFPLVTAFRGDTTGGSGIFTKTGNTVTAIATTEFLSYGNPSITTSFGFSKVAFRANAGFGPFEGIYSNYDRFDGSILPVARVGEPAPTGTFTSFGDPIATLYGVAFEANYGVLQKGIFAAQPFFNLPVEPIIKTGDPLFGSTVSGLALGRFGGENIYWGLSSPDIGNLAFYYELTNGRRGIGLILAVPEPSTWMFVETGAFCIVWFRTRRLLRS